MRLILLPATDAHFAWMLDEPVIPPPLRLPRGGVDQPWVLRWLRRNLPDLEGTGSWLMVDGDEVVGLCSYKDPPDAAGAVDIGYAVAPARRRRGYATAAVALLIEAARADPRLRRLTAETAVDNLPSQRVLEANGFHRTGRSHDVDEGEMIVWGLALDEA